MNQESEANVRRIRIRHGGGHVYEVPLQEKANGSVREELTRLVEERIRDAALRESLRDSRLTLDVFSQSDEKPVDPESKWEELRPLFDGSDDVVELAVGRRARGGCQ